MEIHYYGKRNTDIILIQMVDDHDLSVIDGEVSHIRDLSGQDDFLLAAVKADSWNHDLSPWPAPPVYGSESFGGGASETLSFLTDELVPSLGYARSTFFIGGYSLSGLFALWSAYQTELFSGVSAASPSVWFPGFREYVEGHPIKTSAVYLSLGDKEEKTRNRIMSQVGDSIRGIYSHLENTGTPCTLEWNQGNHFRDPDFRTAKGFAWLINQMKAHGK